MKLGLLLISFYLLGSIPFGVLVGRWRKVDIRKYGSKNIGFSNALRVLGPGPAALVLVGDVMKGLIPVIVGKRLLVYWGISQADVWVLALAVAPILGHTFSVFLGFRGGRAVATTLGTLFGMVWPAALVALGVGLVVLGLTRYISIASIVASSSVPIYLALLGAQQQFTFFWLAVAALIIVRHIPNLGRLLNGTESKLGQRVNL